MDAKKLTPFARRQTGGEDPAAEERQNPGRSESLHRLQIGLSGLAAMVLLVGLANIIQDRARVTEEMSVPETAPTTEPTTQPALTDPLADAGLVPDMPVEPTASPTAIPADQGPKTSDVSDPRR